MRHAITSLLVLLLSFPLVAPVAFAHSAADLPACCRRNGAHHCSMEGAQPSTGQTVSARCGLYPRAQSIPALGSALFVAPQYTAKRYSSELAAIAPTQAAARMALLGSPRKRGPPSLLNSNDLL